MIVQEPVQAAIWHCLNHYDHKDAVFLAERLCSEVENDETIFILATSYYRSNLLHQCYWLLKEKSRRSPQCRYLHARCAFQLKKYSEAECILTNGSFGDLKNFDEIVKDFGEIACFVLHLVAQICIKTERSKVASEALRKTLKLNPFLWQAFVDLCKIGEEVEVSNIFQIPSTDIFNTCQGNVNPNSMILFGAGNTTQDSVPLTAHITTNSNTPASVPQNKLHYVSHNSENSADVLPINQSINNLNGSGINYILSTPTEQQIQPQNNTALQNLNTPNNNANYINSPNSSIAMLRGNCGGVGAGQNSGIIMLDDTPMSEQNNQTGLQNTENGAGTPYRGKFKYLSTVSPTTPSFGILPLMQSPYNNGVDSPFVGSNIGNVNVIGAIQTNLNMSNSPIPPPPQSTLAEVNQDQKMGLSNKKIKGHNIINRKDVMTHINTTTTKPVFTQTGNITPRMPNNAGIISTGNAFPNAAVRGSSRLFSNSAYSVKENNKSPNMTSNKFPQPRSPPRKTKLRVGKICLNNEIIEDKCSNITADKYSERNVRTKDKEKVETITTAGMNRTAVHPHHHTLPEDTKVLLNNSLNTAQSMAHQILVLKKHSADGLMILLRDLGEGYKLLADFQCKAAIKHLEATVPKHHLSTSWVQSLIGMAHYELREYEVAITLFKRIRETDPFRMDYMEIYSSSLWHLQREVDLSALAQDVIGQDKTSPITWCVAGNCFSLHKEHETAIKFFKRAVQVDPDFVYSYTLLGHELVITEELDKAMDYFRAAVIRDPRHYNAWFGIGTIYSKQEKYELAELHYIKALKINPQNSVILVHIGAMQYFMQKKDQALQTLNTAAILEPKNPLARFHRGSIYFSLGKHQLALRELEELKDIVPKESVVFYLMGKIHKALGNVDSALMHFSWATDLDPKGANNQIKDVFDSISHPHCCPTTINESVDADIDHDAERSDESNNVQHEIIYDSDAY